MCVLLITLRLKVTENFIIPFQSIQLSHLLPAILTSLLGGDLNRVAGGALKAAVGRNHKHLVFGVGHQVTEYCGRLGHGAVETFGLLLLTDQQTWDQTGFTPVVQLEKRRRRRRVDKEVDEIKEDRVEEEGKHLKPTLYSLNSPWTEAGSTAFQWMVALMLSTFDARRSVGASVGSELMKRDREDVKSQKALMSFTNMWPGSECTHCLLLSTR